MDRNFSTLELTEHDENARGLELVINDVTARAPERDYDTTPFELDASAFAPQVSKSLYVARYYIKSIRRS